VKFYNASLSLNVPTQDKRRATVSLKSDLADMYGRLVNFYCNPNNVQPPHPVEAWQVPTWIENTGAIKSAASASFVGRFNEVPREDGNYDLRKIGDLNYMLGAWADVQHNYVARGNDMPGSTLFYGLDQRGRLAYSILEDGAQVMRDEANGRYYRIALRNGELKATPL
jgi:hypothetical protein